MRATADPGQVKGADGRFHLRQTIGSADHAPLQHGSGLRHPHHRRRLGVGQDRTHLPRPPHPSFVQKDQCIGKAGDLLDRMGNVQDRQARIAQVFEPWQDDVPAPRVERGQRLVQDQKSGATQQRATDGNPRRLSSRQIARPARDQRRDPQHVRHRRRIGAARRTVKQVFANAKMREQPRFLKDVSDVAPVRRQVRRSVEQDPTVERDAPGVGPRKPRDATRQRCLAGPRWAEDGRNAGRDQQGYVELEIARAARDRHLQHQRPATRAAIRGANQFETSTAATATATAIITNARSGAPPSGTCRKA
ncbi:hypothetical protein JDO7802_02411 [Jannaschia donghaensis]|uniref:Uncharacterized protein n=1 Tax=Jannaschia donghaensis TaxID=420998 RepID=A0A0M6YJ53_9RHOB|nr:hypothetical protein JDO7802_02411 [Jannaschia donghaensis]